MFAVVDEVGRAGMGLYFQVLLSVSRGNEALLQPTEVWAVYGWMEDGC